MSRMAAESSNGAGHNGSSTSFGDLVSNSTLTATASEFVPNSANREKYFNNKKSRPTKSFDLGLKRETKESFYSGNGSGENAAGEANGREANGSRQRYRNRPGKPSSNSDDVNGISSRSDSPSGGQGSRASARFSGKHYNGQRGFNRNSKPGPAASSSSYFQGSREEEGAVGGETSNTHFHNDQVPGSSRARDRNGNKDQNVEQYSDKPFYNDKSKYREEKDPSGSKYQRKDFSRSYNREYEDGRSRSKYWDRTNNGDRETTTYYQDNAPSYRADRNESNFSEKNQDHYQDRYYSDRPNRRYADRYPDRQRGDQNYDNKYYGNYDQDSRGYDRSYRSRGSRFQHESTKEDPSRQRNNSYYSGRNSAQNYNTQETFGSDNFKFHANDRFEERDSSGTSARENNYSSRSRFNNQKSTSMRDGDDVSQRDRLTEQLTRGTLECLVCCDRVRQQDSVWSCSNCFHVLHLKCVMKWAKSSKAEAGWRCPACQNVTAAVPSQYRCFCSKAVEPLWNRQDTPHTCGEVCGKPRENQRPVCVHHCTLLCHPGPCPPCLAQVVRYCGCGKTSQTVKCALEKPLLCESTCGKPLNCGAHTCELKCHTGSCEPCQHKIEQVCYCKKQTREVDCIEENQGVLEFCCNDVCGHKLACGNHTCEEICHENECKPCQLTPDIVTQCPCGQTELSMDPDKKRKTCTDPIPTCGKVCGRKLTCGQPSSPHMCKVECHLNACPPCPRTTLVRCRCGHMDRELPCSQLTTKADDARCEKKCSKKRSCAKHKCNQPCCIEIDHPCPLPCNHTLTCGLHRCEQLCHRGHCQPCWRTSFEELYCECGAEVLYPPIPCGTKPPPCTRPCSRPHDCDHPALHNCHSDANCPPCSVLTPKYCYGKHELRKTIPCHQKDFSCGLPCGKELPCRRHKCIQLCHKEDCLRPGSVCSQPCTVLRPTCQHPCLAPCHEGNCPDLPCKETVRVTCECGHRSAMRPCAENTKEYQRIATSILASKMADVQLGHSIDIGDLMGNASTKKLYLKSLECNEECKAIERNRRMAIGLQIRNPDLSQKLTPRYSDFMRGWAKKDPAFCQYVHDKLTELVKLCKESKQKSRSHSFEVMNREKRQFVHEYCEHFGCESVAYDQEPKRNVVATAQKIKAWLPSASLLELVQRDAGQRRVPGPMLNSVKKPLSRGMDTLSAKWTTIPPGNSATTSSSSSGVSNSTLGLSDDYYAGGSSSNTFIDHFNS